MFGGTRFCITALQPAALSVLGYSRIATAVVGTIVVSSSSKTRCSWNDIGKDPFIPDDANVGYNLRSYPHSQDAARRFQVFHVGKQPFPFGCRQKVFMYIDASRANRFHESLGVNYAVGVSISLVCLFLGRR